MSQEQKIVEENCGFNFNYNYNLPKSLCFIPSAFKHYSFYNFKFSQLIS